MEEENLPEDLKNGLGSSENFDKICKIAENFGVAGKYGEGVGKLDSVFEKTLKGELPPEKTAEEIKRKTGFSDELSQDIAKEMQVQIFSNYKESLDKIYSSIERKKPEEQKEIVLGKAEETAKGEFPRIETGKRQETPEGKVSSLEKDTLKEASKIEEKKEPHLYLYTKKEGEDDEVKNILESLSEEIEKAKAESNMLNKEIKNKEEP